ncbi:MAG: hypothetical protein Q4G50_08150 [Corynebacterium sp.]|uniref:hypothetical protein n=1 Tax=Corynebacterium sp. TaxID=1720 RepID=UPI0026DF76C9|nr:hypothetical protein [Corynebacterium sp.]MDO5669960.1 hypothetical protein [Corynebacterium sp.]
MSKTQTLDVEIRQEGDWWIADIPTLQQTTQARTLAELEDAVSEVACLTTGHPPETFNIRT